MREEFISKLKIRNKEYYYYDLKKLFEQESKTEVTRLPYTLRILLEALLRKQDDTVYTSKELNMLLDWNREKSEHGDIPFVPERIILQDFTGVPAILDLAAMREQIKVLSSPEQQAYNMEKINPEIPVDLVIDHSIQADSYGEEGSFDENLRIEFDRNQERYRFLSWAQESFHNFSVVPPATGIVHQVNLEYLARVVMKKETKDKTFVFPDTIMGTDSHTTMINGLGVLGWGVGGIEAEAGMLGQPSFIPIPEVVGVRITGELKEGTTATDAALKLTKILRSRGVVGCFVEYFGEGVKKLTLAERATIANMAPEYGATCGFFPVDEETLNYLKMTGREEEHLELIREYLENNFMFQKYEAEAEYNEVIEFPLDEVVPVVSGPKRPQDMIELDKVKDTFLEYLNRPAGNTGFGLKNEQSDLRTEVLYKDGKKEELTHGSILIAAITSCTNTSNPQVMLGAGLLAKNAVEKGLTVPRHVKTTLAPGSRSVTGYLNESGLSKYLDQLGFYEIGYGCTTCIGNSGPLRNEIEEALTNSDIIGVSVLSGNRNFEGRIHPLCKGNFLASPILVVAYALAGKITVDLTKDPLGYNEKNEPLFLKDIWPDAKEIEELVQNYVHAKSFSKAYENVLKGTKSWKEMKTTGSTSFQFTPDSTYVKKPPFLETMDGMTNHADLDLSVNKAYTLALFGDSVTTDHISPAGNIAKKSPAGIYLQEKGIEPKDFNTYGSRRGNHEIMMRGTFANIRIRNQMLDGVEGGYTSFIPTGEIMSIYDASIKYQERETPLVVVAGKDYGMGSSRDWAAKGPVLLGVKYVIAESYERIHRSNLTMMGIIPLEFINGESSRTYQLTGRETWDILLKERPAPGSILNAKVTRENGESFEIKLKSRLDSEIEIDYIYHGGILPMVVSEKLKA